MKYLQLIVFLILLGFSTQADDPKKQYQGLLWEVTGNGMEKPSYLYGTMHVSKKLAFHLSDTFFLALKNSEMVVLETDPSTWMEDMSNSDLLNELVNFTRFSLGSYRGFYKKAFKIEPPDNDAIAKVLSKNHHLINNLLYRFSMMQQDFEEDTYLDLFIYQAGKKMKKPVTPLENFEEVMAMMVEGMKPSKKKKPLDRDGAITKLLSEGKNIQELIENSYRKGDLNTLDSLMKLSMSYGNFMEFLIYRRNETMANNIDSLMRSNTLFTGIGAAHLPGEKGVINLLREKGYELW
ncbi:MAG: TraB/GumN family protein [Bacteroidetes bacterium]|nr:TraB/GumN family protein [Bacteroidota bacterium]